jgi:hypothetical protein
MRATPTAGLSPGYLSQVLGVVLGLGIALGVAVVTHVLLLQTLVATGLVRGARDPGQATALEAWLVQNWPVLIALDLAVGAFMGWRMCRVVCRDKRVRRLPSKPMQPASAPIGARD